MAALELWSIERMTITSRQRSWDLPFSLENPVDGDKYRKKLRFVLRLFSKQKFDFCETRFLLQEEREREKACPF